MGIVLLGARLFLAAVFVVAALAKVADRAGSRQALQQFGVPARLTAPLGLLLPLVELALAIALLPRTSAWGGAIGALALLLLFSGVIAYNLVRGRTPDCHCFGQIGAGPVGPSTLIRNLMVALVASITVWQGYTDPGLSAVAWLGHLNVIQALTLIAGLVLAAALAGVIRVLFQILRQQGRLLLRLESLEQQQAANAAAPDLAKQIAALTGGQPAPGAPTPPPGLPVGTPAPGFALGGLYGETVTLDALRAPGKPVLLVFSDPGCGPCTTLLPEIGRWQREHSGALTVAVVSRGTPEANRAKSTEHGIIQVLLQEDREVMQAYQTPGTPSAVLVRPDGTIGSPLALGADAIRALVARPTGAPIPLPMVPAAAGGHHKNGHTAPPPVPAAPKIGDAAPALALPDLTGKTVSLADYRGRNTLVLFWNPGCGFCQRMLDDLKAWEKARTPDAPHLLVVSTGSLETNQAMRLRAPVLLDQNATAMRAFGAAGTPMAVLVDAEGRVASEMAAGAQAVLALAQRDALAA